MPSFYTDFFHEPLTEDVEELLSRFQCTGSVRYGVFSAIWRDMKFSDVFLGTTKNSEMKRFCRVALATAVKYFLPPHSFHIRVGGLYLMFSFYHTQPASSPAQIRLALKDWIHVQRFLTESEEAEHHDVLYIYHKLAATQAFHYTAMPHFLTFQKQKTKPEVQCKEFLCKASALQELRSAEIWEEMAEIQSHYEKLKEAMQVRVDVSMTHPDFTSRLKQCMNEFFSWQQQSASPKEKNVGGEVHKDPEEDCSSRARLLSSIKQKSYSHVHATSKSRRHREVEKVDSSSSDGEQVQKPPSRKTHTSLRARTWQNLGRTDEKSNTKIWLLSTPEQQHGVPLRKMSQAAVGTEYKVKEEAG
ncbi:snRNA-activating protein complex subunit 1-like [Poeciliopsis prolifica]|uniref:snRNA-activating protein complex subunit 1-like n=1 Tax=Poeciliopsis prolifica TaxID=188132 RepID=UPI00241348BB|nr:snRNA-activating protein complex subunit 1-like [Poeciliopsis prolifica]XP_054886982.1 snRNA-activating protein complex subunit 1-like [Poeciliopsis prolifica]